MDPTVQLAGAPQGVVLVESSAGTRNAPEDTTTVATKGVSCHAASCNIAQEMHQLGYAQMRCNAVGSSIQQPVPKLEPYLPVVVYLVVVLLLPVIKLLRRNGSV